MTTGKTIGEVVAELRQNLHQAHASGDPMRAASVRANAKQVLDRLAALLDEAEQARSKIELCREYLDRLETAAARQEASRDSGAAGRSGGDFTGGQDSRSVDDFRKARQ
ncbi:hypothetical protein [Nonomuraea endophytica]|uniref:Putative membrane protein YccC n=1 Tax=Nonomuraea endophytica TaxID=714136 RepID=A0A7W7ZYV5_9ACTN|nr:hypothetical protein [Nonomuraea endophytica]MBB5075830.1 putative membrane protein YccC [Nonomuraea endophytica]